ncbi:putative leucine-rich repeat-containing protein DDB_G0290503 isoform X2 [Myzus persicae]|uniref:putative leucine-rich repeat-containing protein DDB_G0290503 isoform X2 n=1 Tax=Myzus persicae TaxID=13164 RepID=UPI000B930C4D|nr:putative leucine-rich repeat-containing protein DDB_G0290503 isoform X2 [Myzus persicae]XP_022183364.1 putative leucine-rich repeat-containing protein DDB_G0290503 isoform X2 [Myzus persicae]
MAMKRTIDFHLNNQRKKANLYRAIKNDLGNDSSTDEESMSLSPTNLFPLSHYANDPEQLIQQLFSVVRGKRLARLIPPELKDMTFEELKTDCLIQLLCMSKKRVLATLEGKEMNSSSDSDDSIDDVKKQNKLETGKKDETGQKRHLKEKRIKSLKKKKIETDSETEEEKSKEKEGKTLLEILELEMKAKAIRALLGPNQKDNNTQIEEAIKNEIIGEKIEEKNDDKSWSERYEQREDVKDVVKTSKLCTNMRRRMLLHQQKMLADRAKFKAAEAEKTKSGDSIKSKLEEKLQNVYPKNELEPTNVTTLEKNHNETVKEPLGDCNTTQNTDIKLQETSKLHEDDVNKINRNSATSSNEPKNKNNNQESTDDDSQKSTDFEKVLSEYTQKNTDLETTINEYSKKNTDLEEEINECSKRNDDMENTMNKCAQKNSDIESAINNYSVENNGVDDSIVKENEKNEKNGETKTEVEKYSQTNTDLDLIINQGSKKNVDLNTIIKEYAKRNSDIMTLINEYSQNNVDIQSVIGEYAKGNLKLETIIDEYSHINAKIKTMVNEYSVNNSNVEKIIDRNNRKQLLVDKYNVESVGGKAVDADCTKNKIEISGGTCVSSHSGSMETNIEPSNKLVDLSANEEDKETKVLSLLFEKVKKI